MNIHFWTFVFQIFNFVAVAFVLHRLLYRPLHEAIDRRRQATEAAQAEADRAKRDAEALEAQLEAERAEAERRREEVLRETHRQAEAEGNRLIEEARRRAAEQKKDLSEQLERDRQRALAKLREDLVRSAVDLAERFLKQAADRTLHQQLVARLIETLAGLSPDEGRILQATWSPDEQVVIETAAELDPQTLARVTAAVADVVGEKVAIEVKLKPALVSGVCLRLGGHVWDATISGPLAETRRDQPQEAVHA